MLEEAIKQQHDLELIIPALPFEPRAAIAKIEALLNSHANESVALVGSSLGGYYAVYIAEKYHCRATLINPAVRPYELLCGYLGENENIYTGEKYVFTSEHIQQLREIEVSDMQYPSHYLVLLQTGDEILDYRQAVEKFNNANINVMPGGNHSFDEFENVINDIITFSQTSPIADSM